MSNKITKIVIDRKACIGAATCVVVNPQAFDLDNESIAIIKGGALQTGDELLLMAAQACPVSAIFFYDREGNQIYPTPKK
ncbi:MAG: ferredoxin [Patescibacteria group bacterium]